MSVVAQPWASLIQHLIKGWTACPDHPMKLRLINLVVDRLPARMRVMHEGCWFNILTQDYIGRRLLDGTGFETLSTNHVVEALSSGGVFLDVGANIGLYSIIASRNPAVSVVAFEPNPTIFALLEKNIIDNRRSNVTAVCGGLSGETDYFELETVLERNSGATKLVNTQGAASERRGGKSLHPVMHFGQSMARLAVHSIDVLKLDVEGHESAVLGAIDWETGLRPREILIEFMRQPGAIHDSRRDCWELLHGVGYQAFDLHDNRIENLDLGCNYLDGNLVFRDGTR